MYFTLKTLAEMTAPEFCRIAVERTKIFVVEQDCPFQEIDEYDFVAYHLSLYDDHDHLVGYSRIFKKGDYPTFGRVIVPKQYRNNHYGRKLVAETIRQTQALFPEQDIVIEGEAYLLAFYQSFGMEKISDEFLIDNIPHVRLKLIA